MKVWDEQIDIIFVRAALRHVDNRQNSPKVVTYVDVVVGAHASEDDGFIYGNITHHF